MATPDRLQGRLTSWPDVALTFGLLAFAALFIFVALWPGHHAIKALILAWAIL